MRAICIPVLIAAIAGCTATDDTTDAAADAVAAKDQFWTAFRAGSLADIPAARDAMKAALATNPNDDELARWIGFSSVLLQQPTGDQPPDPAVIQAAFDEAIDYVEQAVDASRDSHIRVYNSGFLGGMVYSRGVALGNAADAQRGRDLMEQLTRELPAFGYATRGDVMNRAPVGTPDWDTALESYFRFFEACTGQAIDRANPDLGIVLRRPFASPDSTCTNWFHAAHGIQGFLVNMGDALVKNNQIAAARPVYSLVKQTEGFGAWSYAGIIDSRLNSDLEALAAAYRNPDPNQAPPVGVDCMGCHQQ